MQILFVLPFYKLEVT